MNRRKFFRITALSTGGLLLAQVIPFSSFAQDAASCFQPHPLIKLCDDGSIIIFVARQEMGQGVHTSLPMIVAEEMEADWKDIRVETLPYNYTKATDFDTHSSISVKEAWLPLRQAGATARIMLLTAAAQTWGVPIEMCKAERSKIIHIATGQTLTYKSLITTAAKVPVPRNPALKNYKDFTLIGTNQKKTNLRDILTGKTKYGIDVTLPGMLHAIVVRSAALGDVPIKWNEKEVLKMEGVEKIIEVKALGEKIHNRNGVAVLATSTWAALKASQKLKIVWEAGTNNKVSTKSHFENLEKSLNEPPDIVMDLKGNTTEWSDISKQPRIKATYRLPFLAHAVMEPENCTAVYANGKFELWGGFQFPSLVSTNLSKAFSITPKDIQINLTSMGGGFGRRGSIDYAAEAMQLAKAAGKPVQILFTRKDNLQNGFYRPASVHALTATLSTDKKVDQWRHHIASSSYLASYFGKNKVFIPYEGLGGANGDFYYGSNNFQSAIKTIDPPIPCGAWRSVAFSYNTFVIESFMDELAQQAGADPLQFRLDSLRQLQQTEFKGKANYDPRRLEAVLISCADAIGWNSKQPKRFKGIAACFYGHAQTYVAHAFDISLNKNKITIHNVACSIDCGIVVDPDGLKAQVEGALVWGLSAALRGEITLKNGAVQQQNLKDYGVLLFNEVPPFHVHIIKNTEAPGGAGETSVPSVAPALCNAIAAATGTRIRELPLSKHNLQLSTAYHSTA